MNNLSPSKLVDWSILSIFSYAHRYLFFAMALTLLVTLLSLSLLAKLTGSSFFGLLSRLVIAVCFIGAGLFFTWDSWANYQYYLQIKKGTVITVPMVEKNRHMLHRKRETDIPIYYYTALVQYNQGKREIPISSQDYDQLNPGDLLPVWYNARLDDMMAKDYSLSYFRIFFSFNDVGYHCLYPPKKQQTCSLTLQLTFTGRQAQPVSW